MPVLCGGRSKRSDTLRGQSEAALEPPQSLPRPERGATDGFALTAPGAVFVVDALLACGVLPRAIQALLDEAAHLVTALLLLGALGRRPPKPVVLGTLAGAVVLDLDHIPKELGWDGLTRGTRRPYSHSLVGLMAVALVASLLTRERRRAAVAVGVGVALHLVRDMATGGVPLWWPITKRSAEIPYGSYAAMLVLWSRLVVRRRRSRRCGVSPG